MPRKALLCAPLLAGVALTACGSEPSASARADEASARADAHPDAGAAEAPAPEAEASAPHPLGEPRDDLERFYGVYAPPDRPGRGFFVAPAKRPPLSEAPEIPPGYLMIGATFGDVAPWYMASLSEQRFEQRWVSDFQPEPVAVEFELGPRGEAVALTFTQGPLADEGRLERRKDLPEEWR